MSKKYTVTIEAKVGNLKRIVATLDDHDDAIMQAFDHKLCDDEDQFDIYVETIDQDSDLVEVVPPAPRATLVSETGRKMGKNKYMLMVTMSDGGMVMGYGKNYDEARLDSRKNIENY